MADLPLVDNDKLVFAGDSIFNQKKWACYLAAYFQLRNPSLHLRTCVIGHGGSTIDSYRSLNPTYDYYAKEVQSLEPDYVFIEFGHNGGYTKAEHKTKMQALIEDSVVAASGALPVLVGCNPKATGTGTPIIGDFDDANQEIITALGYGYVNKLWQQCSTVWTNSGNWTNIGGADSTHPGDGGNWALFYKTITGFGWSTSVSQAVIAANTPAVTSDTDCTISALSTNSYGGIDFNRLDDRLPWALDEVGRTAGTALYPAMVGAQNFSTTVTGLTSGTYDIYIGGVFVASKTHTELAAGWNMSDLTNGPYFDQGQAVLGAIRDVLDVDRTTLLANPTPREGVELYKSNASVQYETNGLRDAALKAALSVSLASIASYEAAVYSAKQPVSRAFSLRRQGFGGTEPPAVRSKGLRKAGGFGGMMTWLMMLLFTASAWAGSATLEWDPSPEDDIGYTIEAKPGAELDPGEWRQVASTRELFLKIDNLTPGLWSFRARAVHLPSELSSLPSNVVVTTIIPEAPKLRSVAVQMSRDLETWETVAIVPVPEADRAFYRIAFTK